jgi:Glycine-rich domain-containing protein-like
MNSSIDFSIISVLDLDPIKVKLMHEESGEGWSREHTNAVEREYRRFLLLMKMFPNEPTAPMVDVDTFWHYHILDTMKYATDCEQVFGYFLHHFPYVGMRGKEDEEALERMGERMRVIYEETFGESYLGTARDCDTQVEAAYCGRATTDTAYCGRASTDAAYCGRTSINAAYCERATTDAAYCGRVSTDAAYCGKVSTDAAYCGRAAVSTEHESSGHAYTLAQSPRFYSERPVFATA